MIFETRLSTLNISLANRAPNTINCVDMRLVLVFLATFLQSLFNLFNVQNLIGLYALCNIHQRQMLALAALTDVDGCREDEIADLDFCVYHGHDSHGLRFIIMITGFLMASLSSSSEFEEQLLISF